MPNFWVGIQYCGLYISELEYSIAVDHQRHDTVYLFLFLIVEFKAVVAISDGYRKIIAANDGLH